MKEHDTFPGKVYAITCASGCTITDNQGRTLGECEAGKQTLVVATSDKLLTSADALLTATFKYAPAKLRMLGLLGGGKSELPAGYLRAEFLESTGTQYVDTGLTVTPSTGVRYKVWQDSDAYMVLAGNMKYASDKSTFFPLISYKGRVGLNIEGALYLLTDGGYASSGSAVLAGNAFIVKDEALVGEVNWLNDGQLLFKAESFTEHRPLPKPLQSFYENFYISSQGPIKINNYRGRIFYFDISDGSRVLMQIVPAIDPTGTPCMFDTVSKQPFRNAGTELFIAGFTLAQARKLGRLPKTGGALTVSLPSNYAEDEGVVNALATAQENGWVLTVQTYKASASAVSTFALRRIWVRRTSDENGAYVDVNGTRWQVDWCVDMLTPDGSSPDQHGYELFRSVDVAVSYWELSPYVDPEVEKLLTETEQK